MNHAKLVAAVSVAAITATTVVALAISPAGAADVDPRLAAAQANVTAYCTALVDDATTTRQRNTRADLCAMWTRELADLTPATPTTAPTTTPPAPTSTPTPSPTSPPTPSPTASPTPSPTSTQPPTSGWPDASNTGVPAMTVLTAWTGSCAINSAQTITAKTFSCDLTINAAVTITNSRVAGTVSVGSNGSLVMTDSEVNASPGSPRQVTGVEYHDYTLTRVEIQGGNRGAYCATNCTIRDSYVHGQRLSANWHASAVRMEQYTTLIHNTLICDSGPPPAGSDQGCSASLTGYGDFAPVRDNLIQGNYFPPTVYSAFCAYGGNSGGKPYSGMTSNIRFVDNVFGRGTTSANRNCALYGPITDFDKSKPGNVWTNNKYTDGTTIPV